MDEAELIDGCRRRDREAQRELYERFVERIHRLVLRLSGNPQDAFDLTQETFMRAFDGLAAFEGRAGLTTWLYRVATNEALQLFRRRKTEQRHVRAFAERRAETLDSGNQIDRLEVEDALARLSDQHRAVLVLKYQEGLSYDEIAEVLECAPGTVASRLNRARVELRSVLAGETPGPAEEISRLRHQE